MLYIVTEFATNGEMFGNYKLLFVYNKSTLLRVDKQGNFYQNQENQNQEIRIC